MDYRWAYELVRDAVMEHLDPQDGDEAEPAIMEAAIARAGQELKQLRSRLMSAGEQPPIADAAAGEHNELDRLYAPNHPAPSCGCVLCRLRAL